jgi:uncharacterized protein YkwD
MSFRFHRSLKVFLFMIVLLSSLILPAKPTWAFTYSYVTFPDGKLGIARPDIGVNFLELTEPLTPVSYEMYLNNKLVNSVYDPQKKQYIYHPATDLPPGVYTAKLVFRYEGYQAKTLQWSFTILGGAAILSAGSTAEQRAGLQAINDYRQLLGLSPVVFNNALNTAALKHAHYLAANKIDPVNTSVSLHDENPAGTAFIGQSLMDRINFVGYGKGAAEDVAYKRSTLVEAIDSLFDAPYHRSPFLSPDMVEIGIAKEGDYHVVEFGYQSPATSQLVVSPSDGDIFVPTAFDGHEAPDPIRMHNQVSYPVGYPLMASVTGPGITRTALQSATLVDESGKKLELLQNQASNDDHLDTEVILLPAEPLKADTVYQASIKLTAYYKDGKTQSFDKSWKFRTEQAPGFGSDKLHADASGYMLQIGNLGLIRQHSVSFGLDNNYYLLDQIRFPMMRTPYIVDGTSFLYIRDLAAALGASVSWDDTRKAAIYKKNDKTVTFFTKRNVYAIDGVEYSTGAPAQLINEMTMIPVRLLSYTLGAKVDYIESTRTVILTY